MTVELSFWQEYGPRIVVMVMALIVGGGLATLGRAAARAYEAQILSKSKHFWSLPKKRRRQRRASYEAPFAVLTEKAKKARSLQEWSIRVAAAVIALFGARTAVDFISWSSTTRWIVAVAFFAVVMAGLGYLQKQAATKRWATLEAAMDLDQTKEEATR